MLITFIVDRNTQRPSRPIVYYNEFAVDYLWYKDMFVCFEPKSWVYRIIFKHHIESKWN